MWIKPTSWSNTAHPALLVKRTAADNGYFIFKLDTTSTINIDWGGSPDNRWNTGYLPSLNEWKQITYSYDGTNGKFYLNGILSSSTTKGNSSVINTTSVLRIGKDTVEDRYWYDGLIDDIRIYNRALTETEVKILYNTGQ